MKSFDVWLLVDQDGEYVASDDREHCAERYDELIGNDSALGRRMVKVTVNVPLPVAVELKGTAPAEGAAELEAVQ